MNPQTLFFLGATGYIGSQFLVSVKQDAAVYAKLKEFTLVALVRDPESAKSKQLLDLWPGIVLVKGSLDDTAIVEEQATKSDITFNSASSDHEPSVKGLTPDCPLYRIFANLFIQSGIVGTWGPGHNKIGAVHIRDVGTAFSAIFKLVLEGKAKERDEGFYFINSEKTDPLVMKRLAEEMGKILHANGLVKDPEVKPFPEAVIGAFGEFGWSGFGGNWSKAIPERLREAGWEPSETQRLSLWDSLPLEVERFVAGQKSGQ